MKVWITKYALTTGIQEVDDAQISGLFISVPSLGVFAIFHGEGRDWHKTLSGAKSKAETMRLKKIRSLNKSLKKLEAMKF